MDISQIESLGIQLFKAIVECPDEVETHISEGSDEKGELTIINVKVNKKDVGVCIGDQGKTAEAIRRVIGLIGFKKLGVRLYVKIDAPRLPKNHFQFDD